MKRSAALHQRVRGVFFGLTIFVCLLDLFQLPALDLAGDLGLAAVAYMTVAAVSAARYWKRRPFVALDPLVPAMVVVIGIVHGDPGWVFALSFITLWFRAMYGSRRHAVANAVLYFGAWQVLAVSTGGALEPVTVIADAFAYVVTAVLVHHLGMAVAEHDRAARWERVLAMISGRLLTATTTGEVHELAVEAMRDLLGADGETDGQASFWTGGEDMLRLAASVGERLPLPLVVDLSVVPEHLAEAYRRGRPFITTPTETQLVEDLLDSKQGSNMLVAVPIPQTGRLAGVVVAASRREIDRGLLDVLDRFANEISLSLERCELMERLQGANDELRRADELKDRFVSNVSHELRTPLTAIRGFAQTIRDRWWDFSEEQRREFMNRIIDQSERQLRMIDDLLLTSRLLSGVIETRPSEVDVSRIVREAANDLHLDHVDIAASDTRALVDPDHLYQMVANLLTNASKYGRPPIVVTVELLDGHAELSIRDHGDGVPPEVVPDMFERFRQAEQTTASGGVGLGLSILHDLARANDATVSYQDAEPGARFTLTLPAAVSRLEPSRQAAR